MGDFKCEKCSIVFSTEKYLKRHDKSVHEKITHQCNKCEKYFARHDNLQKHKQICGKAEIKSVHQCENCNKQFNRPNKLRDHLQSCKNLQIGGNTLMIQQNNAFGLDQSSASRTTNGDDTDPSLLLPHWCKECPLRFSTSRQLAIHVIRFHQKRTFKCDRCKANFKRKDYLTNHLNICKGGKKIGSTVQCDDCKKSFSRHAYLTKHRIRCKKSKKCDICSKSVLENKMTAHLKWHEEFDGSQSAKKERKLRKMKKKQRKINGSNSPAPDSDSDGSGKSLRNQYRIISLTPSSEQTDLPLYLDSIESLIVEEISEELERNPCKWFLSTNLRFEKDTSDRQTTNWIRTRVYTTLPSNNVVESVKKSFAELLNVFAKFLAEGSGMVLDAIVEFRINIFKYEPLAGSSFIPLPVELERKRAIVNVENEDEKCFMWSVLAGKYPSKSNKNRVSSYKQHENKLNMEGIEFPVKIHQISKFENQNNISINLFGYEKKQFFPIYISEKGFKSFYDLLLISDGEKRHYCYIPNINRLFRSLTSSGSPGFYCRYCLHRFSSNRRLNEHKTTCAEFGVQKTRMPSEENKWEYFKSTHFQMKIPFYIVADFECLAVSTGETTNEKDKNQAFTVKTATHVPCGFCYYVVGPTAEHCKKPFVYRGKDAAKVMLKKLREESEQIELKYANPVPLVMTAADEHAFHHATKCHICEKSLEKPQNKRKGKKRKWNNDGVLEEEEEKEDITVRDHCHITGKFRGAAHNSCNLRYRVPKKIPVLFHNLTNYDAHLLMQEVGPDTADKISCIAENFEKYISFQLDKLVFLDSLRFMNASLDNLVKNLSKSGMEKFSHLSNWFSDCEEDQINLLLRKGVYPYEYFDTMLKFEETELPSKEHFYNKLTDSHISDEDYEHAQLVWNSFGMKKLGDYHDLYVKTDVLLLACAFENFRDICYKGYGLDCLHVYTAPGLSWNAALKMTGVKLELFTDVNMYQFIEKGMRGGVSTISKRYAEANNPYMGEQFDPEKPTSYIMYLDCNNLYGWAMSQPLPVSDYRWLDCQEMSMMDTDFILKLGDYDDYGYILEVDLEYPNELHNSHSDYPLAPEKIKITKDMLSPHSLEINRKLGQKKHFETVKLVPNLMDKEKYICHYRNLKLYLQRGMVLKHVHRVIRFKQYPWLKKYIDFNTNMRTQAADGYEKDFWKLMNNAFFGRTMMNVRKRKNIAVLVDEEKLKKEIASPAFYDLKEFKPDLVAVQRLQDNMLLDKTIGEGMTILDVSKVRMGDANYALKDQYGDKMSLLFTDTDSLCIHVETEDFYRDMEKNIDLYDTSDYPPEHFLHSNVNKKVIGKFKDETNGKPITHFCGLRAKMYAMLIHGMMEKKTAKGISKTAIKKILNFEKYRQCLFNCTADKVEMMRFQSELHQIYTVELNKTGLSPADDKRFLLDDGIHTLAHGHVDAELRLLIELIEEDERIQMKEMDQMLLDYDFDDDYNYEIPV